MDGLLIQYWQRKRASSQPWHSGGETHCNQCINETILARTL